MLKDLSSFPKKIVDNTYEPLILAFLIKQENIYKRD